MIALLAIRLIERAKQSGRAWTVWPASLAALVPIWLYRGRQGRHTGEFRRFCYAFYPAHMLLLYLPACGLFRP